MFGQNLIQNFAFPRLEDGIIRNLYIVRKMKQRAVLFDKIHGEGVEGLDMSGYDLVCQLGIQIGMILELLDDSGFHLVCCFVGESQNQ